MERLALNPVSAPESLPRQALPGTVKPPISRGRTAGSRSAYLLELEEQVTRQAGLKQGLLSDPALGLRHAAFALGISYSTIRVLIKTGQLRVSKTSRNGHYRVRTSELRRLAKAL